MKRFVIASIIVLATIVVIIALRPIAKDEVVREPFQVAPQASANLSTEVAPSQQPVAPSAPLPQSPPAEALPFPPALAANTDKPDREAQKTQARLRSTHQRYRALFDELGFNEAQRAEFLGIRLKRMENGDRLIERMRANGITPDTETTRVVFDQTGAEMENDLKEAFGPELYRKMDEYENTVPARGIVNELAITLQYGSDTLSSVQARELVRIIAENAVDRNTGKVDVAHASVSAITRSSLSLLTPVQQRTLEQILVARTSPSPLSVTAPVKP